jgi:hypothetical protein
MEMPEVRTTFRGKRLGERTVAMVKAAEALSGFEFILTQGSYNTDVPASKGTHDGGGALDIRARDLSDQRRQKAVLSLRQVGFAAWLRTPSQADWPFHIHAIAAGDQDLSPGAANQIRQYQAGRNGLAARGADNGPDGYRLMTWELFQRLRQAKLSPQVVPGTPPPNTTISLGAMQFARLHDGMNGVWGADRAQVLAWAAHPKVAAIQPAEIRPPAGRSWHEHFIAMTKKIQRRFNLPEDGVFGPVTAAVMKRFGYTITN